MVEIIFFAFNFEQRDINFLLFFPELEMQPI